MPKRGMAAIRRPQLIEATMHIIDSVGFSRANVQAISSYAGVTPAIINHYFGGKDGLIEATMRQVLRCLGHSVRGQLALCHPDDVVGRIKAIVLGNFDNDQISNKVIKTWLAFWALAMHDPQLHRLQHVNEQRLLSHLRLELKRVLEPEHAIFVAQAIAALIDGIWLRGALNPNGVNVKLAQSVINDYLEHQLPAEVLKQHQAFQAAAQDAHRF